MGCCNNSCGCKNNERRHGGCNNNWNNGWNHDRNCRYKLRNCREELDNAIDALEKIYDIAEDFVDDDDDCDRRGCDYDRDFDRDFEYGGRKHGGCHKERKCNYYERDWDRNDCGCNSCAGYWGR